MNHRLALVVVLLGGCTFNAPPPATYRCSAENPSCPAGQTCVGNLCVSSSADARADLARGDAPRADAKRVDARADAKRDGTKLDGPRKDLGKTDLPRADLAKGDLPKADLAKGDLPKLDLLPTPDLKPCGNGMLNPGEECDGAVFPSGKNTCQAYNRNGGTLGCTNACTVDLSKCCLAGVPPVTVPAVSRIVSASVGSDSTTAPLCTPYQTITAALQGAPSGTVWVMPGTYSASTNGEKFPIVLPATVNLLGDEATRGVGGSSSGPTLVSGAGAGPAGPATFQTSSTSKLSGFRITGPTTTGAAIYVQGQNTNLSQNTLDGYGGVRADKPITGTACPVILQNTFNTSSVGVETDCGTTQIQANTFNGTAVGVRHLAGSGAIHGNTFNGCATHGLQINAGGPPVTQNTFTGSGSGAFTSGAIIVGVNGSATSATPRIRGATFPATLAIWGVRIVGNGKPDLGTSGDLGNNKFGITRLELVPPSMTIDALGNEWAPISPNNPTCSPPLPPGTGQIQIVGNGSSVIWGTGGGQNCHNP
jgi:hypothetical protein